MIVEKFVTGVVDVILFLFRNLPSIDWNVNSGALSYILNIIRVAGYMLPSATVVHLFRLLIQLNLLRIGISFVRFFIQFIPFF